MNTAFLLSGGAGRVIASIPALEKYHRLNPHDDFKIIVQGWEKVFWNHPTLQSRVLPEYHRNLFQDVVRHRNLVSPEPYHLHSFYNQQTNLVEAFDEIINATQDHSDLSERYLYCASVEQHMAREFIQQIKSKDPRKKSHPVLVIQPYGSTATWLGQEVIDSSNRSLRGKTYLELVSELSKHFNIIYVGSEHLRTPYDSFTTPIQEGPDYIRNVMAVIMESDYYVGVCSMGQHMARGLNRRGLILMGATHEKNFGYHDHFRVYRKSGIEPVYMPWRISESDSHLADRLNDNIMDFDRVQCAEIIDIIMSEIGQNPIYSARFDNNAITPGPGNNTKSCDLGSNNRLSGGIGPVGPTKADFPNGDAATAISETKVDTDISRNISSAMGYD